MQREHQKEKPIRDMEGRKVSHEGYGLLHGNYYALLPNQQVMLEDTIRTGIYQSAVINNIADFADKVVLDVGTGTGILSFFAAQAGARKVYAVEATAMSEFAKALVEANGLSDRIEVMNTKIEDLELPEKVDVIISEPMGVLLVHERMLEPYVMARTRWLKPGGKMFPSIGRIFLAPFSDSYLYTSTFGKSRFWEQKSFFGVDISSLETIAREQYFSRPVVGPVDPNILMAAPAEHEVDFNSVTRKELIRFDIDFSFVAASTGIVHGLAGWFDVSFEGSALKERLTTSPHGQGTHWHQIRFIFQQPLAMNDGQCLSGSMSLTANDERSYDLSLSGGIEGTDISVSQNYSISSHQYWWHSSSKPQDEEAYPQNYGLYPVEPS